MRCRGTVHPHGRGDNREQACSSNGHGGSPPRAWGQSKSTSSAYVTLRFTPTGVGTMCSGPPGACSGPVHPHGRGDNVQETIQPLLRYGSPPRAWGQCRAVPRRDAASRFTPTGVGTKSTQPRVAAVPAVHPHGRGDNVSSGLRDEFRRGSPPRAWGQSSAAHAALRRGRFTPTGVGTMTVAAAKAP